MKKTILFFLVLILIIGMPTGVAKAKLIACVGDSITYGSGILYRASNCYPAQLATILHSFDSEWETQNFGVSGATLLRNGDRPYVNQSAYKQALAAEPSVVIIMLGTNDSKPHNWVYKDEYVSDYLFLIDSFAALPSAPDIWICKPVPAFISNFGISDAVIKNDILPFIDQIAQQRDVRVIDLYTALSGAAGLFPDGIHPNTEGAKMIAETVASIILGFRFSPDLNGDEIVDIEDLIILIDYWGQDESSCDIAPPPFGDGIVDRADLEVLMAYWEQEILDPALRAYWKLDETEGDIAYDSVGEKDADVIGDAVWQPDGGKIDGAIELDGVDDYISTPIVLNPEIENFSVFAWINRGAAGQVIISQEDGVNWLLADAEKGALRTDITDPIVTSRQGTKGGIPLISSTVITDGNWHRVGFVRDGTERILYVDDIKVACDTVDNLDRARESLYIGADGNLEAGSFWTGMIDDVRIRIFDRAITP